MSERVVAYPIVVKATPSTWRDDEYASFEDHADGRDDAGQTDHVYTILGRRRAAIVVENADEVATVLRSASYHGDSGGWDDRGAFRRAVARLGRELRDATATEARVVTGS